MKKTDDFKDEIRKLIEVIKRKDTELNGLQKRLQSLEYTHTNLKQNQQKRRWTYDEEHSRSIENDKLEAKKK